MPQTTIQNTLPFGTILVRHYDSDYNIEQQCGTLSYYQALENQLHYQAQEYYDVKNSAGAVVYNKFGARQTLNIISSFLPMPPGSPAEAYCNPPDGSGELHLYLRYFGDTYKMLAALSHEVGHAHHFWTRMFDDAALLPFRQLWERQVSTNKSLYDPYAKPWDQPWGPDSRDEDGREQYANAFRYFFGVLATRGVSGAGTTDPVVPGFENPANHPEWKKQIQLMPETCAFARAFGVKPGSLSWQGGATGYWQFQRNDGVWVAQTDYYAWFEYKYVNGGWTWVQYWPSYSVN